MVLAGGSLTNMQERKTHRAFFSYHVRPQVTCSNRVSSSYRHKKKEKKCKLIDRKTISAFLRLWFGQQHSTGISNFFSRPLSIISQGWTFVATEKKEKKKEGHDNLSKDISWIIDKCMMGKLH